MAKVTCPGGCGAECEAVDITPLGQSDSVYVAGRPLEPCRCPRCIACGRRLQSDAEHPICSNLGCVLYEVWQLVPDLPMEVQ